MRGLIYFLSTIAVVALAYWAYHQGYETRQTAREVARLQRDLGAAHEKLSVLRAEWAYQNRPRRLRQLAEMNFERLGLMPLAPEQFGTVTQISYPGPGLQMYDPLLGKIDLSLSVDTVGFIETLSGSLAVTQPRLFSPAPYDPRPEAYP
jgi:hypothetical protein